jgi:hypothetical protein
MIELKTAKEFRDYIIDNKLANSVSVSLSWTTKHFQLILDDLHPNEKIFAVFVGLYGYKGGIANQGNFAFAITNERLILAQKQIIGSVLQSVNLEHINDVTLDRAGLWKAAGINVLCIDTLKEKIYVGINTLYAKNVLSCVSQAIFALKNPQSQSSGDDSLDQLKKLKELLDGGVITEEEFEAKKKQLLGV